MTITSFSKILAFTLAMVVIVSSAAAGIAHLANKIPVINGTSTVDEATLDESSKDEASKDEATGDEATVDEFELGDVNRDGKLNIRDATAIQKTIAKLSKIQ